MKDILLSYISNEKKNVLESLIDSVLSVYGSKLQLELVPDGMSRFSRIPAFETDKIIPSSIIYLSQSGDTETGLVHELLHLALPLKTSLFLYGQIGGTYDEIMNLINNMAEHDLMLEDFIKFGYDIKQFLSEGFNEIDYAKEINEQKWWWKYEYFRILITKDHVDSAKAEQGELALIQIREYGEKYRPGILNEFNKIDAWLINKRNSPINEHAIRTIQLCDLILSNRPGKYLSSDTNGKLTPVDL